MENKSRLTAWAIAVVAILIAILGWYEGRKLQAELFAQKQENDALSYQVASLNEFGDVLEEQEKLIDELTAEVDRLRGRLENAMGDATDAPAEVSEMSSGMMEDLFSGILGDMEGLIDEDINLEDLDLDSAEDQESMMQWIQSINENEGMRNAQTNMMINLQYAPILDELQLSPEKEATVRDILAMHAREELDRSLGMMGSESLPSGQELQDLEEDAQQRLLAELAEVLDTEEMAAFEAYEQDKEYYVLQQTFDMQIGMFGAGIHGETRELTREILAEETLAVQEALRQGENAMNHQAALESNLAAMENARNRLESSLTPEEFGKVDTFISTMTEMYTASMAMFGDMGQEE